MSSFKLQDTKGGDWDKLAVDYKKFSSGPGTAAIKVMLERTNATLPFSQATAILDNGCGPGPVTSHLIKLHGHEIPKDCELLAADFSEGMIKQVEAAKSEAAAGGNNDDNAEVWKRVQTKVVNATDMSPVADGSKSHVLAGWVYFMTPDPQACLTESLRVLKPGGVLACTSWEGSQWLDIMNTLSEVRPDFKLPSLPEKWAKIDLMKKELETAGFRDVQSERMSVTMQFETHEGLVDFMIDTMPFTIAFTKQMTAKEVQRYRDVCVAKCKEFCLEAPGELHGTALLALGLK